jgi:endonuclease/exonuclease/phosphatase family metal-dependent hydrolase
MTYNVHGCVGVDRRLDVGRVAAVIAQSRPDVVALQELDIGRARSGRVDQARTIAARLGMGVHFNCTVQVQEEQYGDAILTPLPHRLVRTGPLPTLPRTRLERRGALWVAVEAGPGVELQVINTHLGLVPLEQRAQTQALLGPDWVGHPDFTGPSVLLGDLNATSRYAAYRMLADRLRDVQRGPAGERRGGRTARTFPARMPVLRIDHMFIGENVEVLDVQAPMTPLSRVASDHLPLVADLLVGPRRPPESA